MSTPIVLQANLIGDLGTNAAPTAVPYGRAPPGSASPRAKGGSIAPDALFCE
jgi:hypothetical protein